MRESKGNPQVILADLIAKAQARVAQEAEQIIKEENRGYSLDHWRILKELSQIGPRSMGELHASTAINDSTLTKIVDKLVRNGFVYRRPDENDRRKVIIYASSKGDELAIRLTERIAERQQQFFPQVSGQELEKLSAVLRQIAQ